MSLKRNTRLTLIFWGCVTSFFLAALMAFPIEAQSGTWEASYYGSELAGSPTACSGTPYDPSAMVAAHKSLPCGTRLLVRHEGRGVVVTVDDRGPFVAGRDLDLSEGAASVIGLKDEGAGEVEVSEVPSSTSETLPQTGGPTS